VTSKDPPLTVVDVSDSDSDSDELGKKSKDPSQPEAASDALTVVEVSDCDSENSADLMSKWSRINTTSTPQAVSDSDINTSTGTTSVSDALNDLHLHLNAQSTAVTVSNLNARKKTNTAVTVSGLPNTGTSANVLQPAPTRAIKSGQISTKSSIVNSAIPHPPLPGSSTSSPAQTPRRGKRLFYVVTKGRRTGVFDSW
jgi:hypothetical protein